jgi:hypothetical protein
VFVAYSLGMLLINSQHNNTRTLAVGSNLHLLAPTLHDRAKDLVIRSSTKWASKTEKHHRMSRCSTRSTVLILSVITTTTTTTFPMLACFRGMSLAPGISRAEQGCFRNSNRFRNAARPPDRLCFISGPARSSTMAFSGRICSFSLPLLNPFVRKSKVLRHLEKEKHRLSKPWTGRELNGRDT